MYTNLDSRNHADLECTFDEMDAAEQLSSSGRSTPVRDEDRDVLPEPLGGDGGRPALEPGLASKPPIPPAGHALQQPDQPPFGGGREAKCGAVTFDDAVELKFQRWFPHSASPPVIPATAADGPLNGVSYEYCSERVIGHERGTVTYTRSSSSMSIRGGQEDQLDEEHLYSNLSAAIGGQKLKASVSVDLLDALRNEDDPRRRQPSPAAKFKKRTKKTVPMVAASTLHKARKDVPPRPKQPSGAK